MGHTKRKRENRTDKDRKNIGIAGCKKRRQGKSEGGKAEGNKKERMQKSDFQRKPLLLELMTRLELVTSSLPRMCATTCATSADMPIFQRRFIL
jgi:hypothetical protein